MPALRLHAHALLASFEAGHAGFVTDAFGLFLIAPPTRAIVRRALVARLARRGAMRVGVWAAGRRPASAPQPYDVDGTAHEEPRDRPRLP